MGKFRVWYGEGPTYKKASTLAEAIRFIKKKPDFDESNSGLEEQIDSDYWDEWLDEDDQNVHEHLYMYGGKSKYLRSVQEDELEDEADLDDEELDDDDDDEIDSEDLEDDLEDVANEDLDDRLMDVIGGGRAVDTNDVDEDEDLDEEEDDKDAEDVKQ